MIIGWGKGVSVYELLNNSSNKSSLLDPLPTFLLKSPKEQLVPVITKIVNFSLLSGTVSYQFRQSTSNFPSQKKNKALVKTSWRIIDQHQIFFFCRKFWTNYFCHNFKPIWRKKNTAFSKKPICIPKVPRHRDCSFGSHQCLAWPSW